jgi:hypothetical protein
MMVRKIKHLKVWFALLVFFPGFFIPCRAADSLPVIQSEQAQKAFKKLDLQIEKKKLSSKECEKLGRVPQVGQDTGGREFNNHVEYDGCTYSLKFRNGSDTDLQDITVEYRFYYEVTESWRARKRESNTVQKYLDYSFKIPRLASQARYSVETPPFVLESYNLPSGYSYNNAAAEVVECDPKGLWVRLSQKTVDGSRAYIDFCEPSSLSSKITW